MEESITPKLLKSFGTQQKHNKAHQAAMQRAVTTNGIYASSESNALSATNTTVFSLELETGRVTDQKSSGRCWLFATLNILRHQVEKEYKLEDFEFSESYSYFWDKLEKSNYFYEQIIRLAALPLDDRRVTHIFSSPQNDGGWWEYSAAVIMKYGVVPKYVMPEAISTSDSYQLNVLLNRMLRKGALDLRHRVELGESTEAVRYEKDKLLGEVYHFLTIAIGTPPTSFTFNFKDKDKKYHRDDAITPLEFLKKYTHTDFSEYVSILNDPSSTKAYNQTYRFEDGGNVVGGLQPLLLNVDMPTLRQLAYQQIKAGEAVWFGCDVQTDTNKKGFMSLDVYDFDHTFDLDFSLDKADRLMSRDSSTTHAMTITGADVVDKSPIQWKVENSWGEDRGLKGYYTMSNEWFDKNGYVVVIRRDLLSEKLRQALAQEPIVIPAWDPLNSMLPN